MYEFSRFRFDPENHLLEGDGKPIPLTPKAFEILRVLVQNGSRLTTKEELMRQVWPDSFVEEANLTVTISALRKQLANASDGQQYIETVPKKGYRFAVPVSARPNEIQSETFRGESGNGEQALTLPAELAIAPAAMPTPAKGSQGLEVAVPLGAAVAIFACSLPARATL